MSEKKPHYFLFVTGDHGESGESLWKFVLQPVEGDSKMVVSDREPEAVGERLELLALVRGLEALDQPSRVTLVTESRYVSRGVQYGLEEWRENAWMWERFGCLVPIKDRDLWQRVDQALKFHRLECRTWRVDAAHSSAAAAAAVSDAPRPHSPRVRRAAQSRPGWSQRIAAAVGSWRPRWATRPTGWVNAGSVGNLGAV
ncbi:MAG: RNase H family protein [Pirellulales bacterium]